MPTPTASDLEPLENFRARAASWIAAHLPPVDAPPVDDDELQRRLFDGGFAGIAFDAAYGGAGLTLEHQRVFYEEAEGHQTPSGFGVSIAMLGATLHDHGSETLKRRHLPAILRGDERWVQLLSEPTGGSDLAGALTRLTPDGDCWVLNGSKMWSSGAASADFGVCLARSDWDVPKHRGLSMIAVPLHAPGVTIAATRGVVNTDLGFCQEWFDDVRLPGENLIGKPGAGWEVARTLLFHERNASAGIGHGWGLVQNAGSLAPSADPVADLIAAARRRGVNGLGEIRALIAEAYVEYEAARQANDRIQSAMAQGHLVGPWASLLKLNLGMAEPRQAEIALAVHGAEGLLLAEGRTDSAGEVFLTSRTLAIAGGTNEIQRNIISERLLGLPREPSVDSDLPFRAVLDNRRQREKTPYR